MNSQNQNQKNLSMFEKFITLPEIFVSINAYLELHDILAFTSISTSFRQLIHLPEIIEKRQIFYVKSSKDFHKIVENWVENSFICKKIIFQKSFENDYMDFHLLSFLHGLEKIVFNDLFDVSIEKIKFPDTLKKITFGFDFNQLIFSLPEQLESIKFGESFNQQIESYPQNLEKLVFGSGYNQQITNLPTSLKFLQIDHISLIHEYIHDKDLPKSIREIRLGFGFFYTNLFPDFVEKLKKDGVKIKKRWNKN